MVQLEVWDITRPGSRNTATACGFSESLVRHYHGGAGSAPAKGYDDIVKRYYASLHEHRIDPTSVNASIDFPFDEDGTLMDVDWSEYDAWVCPWMDGRRFDDGQGVCRFYVGRFVPGRGTGSLSEAA